MLTHCSPLIYIVWIDGDRSVVARVKDSAPLKLPTRYCFRAFLLRRLEYTLHKNGISLLSPQQPRSLLQPLPSMLRIYNVYSIPSCSKASGVFSSSCR